jgi:hypothetical protein
VRRDVRRFLALEERPHLRRHLRNGASKTESFALLSRDRGQGVASALATVLARV